MSYEFKPAEDVTITAAAGRSRQWGTVSAALGGLQLLLGGYSLSRGHTTAGLAFIVQGALALVIGSTFTGVGRSLKSIVDTRGDDIGHLMKAMNTLNRAIGIQIVVTVLAFVIGFFAGAGR